MTTPREEVIAEMAEAMSERRITPSDNRRWADMLEQPCVWRVSDIGELIADCNGCLYSVPADYCPRCGQPVEVKQ